jgi:hypothetical protein
MLVSAIILAVLFLATLAFIRRKRTPLRRWRVVSDGAGNFSFYDGEGYLYPLDYPSFERAGEKMSEIMASLPSDLDSYWHTSRARESRYDRSFGS